jgi:UDPglucose 6-dehydrogenase
MPDGFSAIVKSTVIPGTTRALQKKYPKIKIACSPEFLRAEHSVDDFKHQKMLVVGTDDYKLSRIILNHHLDSGIDVQQAFFVVTPAQAEIVKYAMNTFYALKVIFGNKFQELTEIMGEDWSIIKQIITFPRDRGIMDTHLEDIGEKGFGGHCLPKDAFAFSKLLDDFGIDSNLIRTIISENRKYRKETK